MQCPECEQRNASNNYFCVNCGADLRPPKSQRDEPNVDVVEHESEIELGSTFASAPSVAVNLKRHLVATEDLTHGQVVIIAARWVLVGAGLLLALWNPDALGELQVQILLILDLAVGNFFLHSQVLMGRPVPPQVAYGASAADIAVISMIVIAAGGFESGLFVFYLPAILGFSVAFRTEVTFAFAGAAVVLYGLIALATMGTDDGAVLLTRMIMMAGVAVCGTIYWRTEGERRRVAAESRETLVKELQQAAIVH